MGDTPAGALENVVFDSKTGRLSFSARLTMGLHGCKFHNHVPSQDVFRFDGVFLNGAISGTLRHSDNLHHEQAPTEEAVVLKKLDNWVVTQYRNREQWDADTQNILKFRGPRW